MSAKAGIRKHGDLVRKVLMNEFFQLDDMSVFTSVLPKDLTPEQRKGALMAISVIKEKRDGSLKDRTCADGCGQRGLFEKEDTAAPTVHTDSFMMVTCIEAKERCFTATGDVKGAFLIPNMPYFTTVRFVDKQVDALCEVNAKYKPFVMYEGKRKVLYVVLNTSLYGTIQAILLWYELYSTTLKSFGFKLNLYDLCVTNKLINNHQCTIMWHVDDSKISHVTEYVVRDIVKKIEEKFGDIKANYGTKQDFLGIKINYRDDGRVEMDIRSYLQKTKDLFNEDLSGAASAARNSLFDVDSNSPKFPETKRKLFHQIFQLMLYIGLRGRKDLMTAISFLTQRVLCATEEDYSKLRRLMNYIHSAFDLIAIVGIEDLGRMYTWIDSAYTVHRNIRGHTGGACSFDTGFFSAMSSKQKLNTTSSTECELVGNSEFIKNPISHALFMEAQGYPLIENKTYHDNQSTIKLMINRRNSCEKWSRHIEICHFYVKDLIDKQKITLSYCLTELMLTDFFSKPLQGSLF